MACKDTSCLNGRFYTTTLTASLLRRFAAHIVCEVLGSAKNCSGHITMLEEIRCSWDRLNIKRILKFANFSDLVDVGGEVLAIRSCRLEERKMAVPASCCLLNAAYQRIIFLDF